MLNDGEEEGVEEESQARDSSIDVDGGNEPRGGIALPSAPAVPEVPHEDVDLPGWLSHELQDDPGPIPQVGLDWNNVDVIILSQYLSRKAERELNV